MKINFKKWALASVITAISMPVLAEDVALVIGNGFYHHQPQVHDARRVVNAKNALEAAGFRVFFGRNQAHIRQNALAHSFMQSAKTADRLVVVLAGQIASNSRDSWLLAVDARNPDRFSIGASGLSLGAIMDVLGEKPGGAMLFVGQSSAGIILGKGLGSKPENMPVAQGVTLVRGPTDSLARFLEHSVLVPGQSVGQAVNQAPATISVSGFISNAIAFLPKQTPIIDYPDRGADTAYWQAVQIIGTVAAMQSYIDRYPNGLYILEANRKIADLQANPERIAQAVEQALNLSRQQRRQIQRNLSILGFNPRGIDGVFGRGSRTAIGAWQQSRGIDGYGYLTGNQVTVLHSTAAARAVELEEEAQRRREELERQDAIYWRHTGRNGTEEELRAYLKRYPDGIYSETAKVQVLRIEEARRQQAAAAERRYWDKVQAKGTAQAYRSYLQKYPRGSFVGAAKNQLAILQGAIQNQEIIRQAKADEARVAGNGIARLLVEQKLKSLGLKPGRVDGVFDDKTRRAVRKFQRARQIPVTGYVTQQTIVRLLAAR